MLEEHPIFNIAYRDTQYYHMKVQQIILKPQDVLLLLKIICQDDEQWNQLPMAKSLGLSQSEVSEAVARAKYAGFHQKHRAGKTK